MSSPTLIVPKEVTIILMYHHRLVLPILTFIWLNIVNEWTDKIENGTLKQIHILVKAYVLGN